MSGSLFNIAINIGQQPSIFKEALIPLISVFIGAILAHKYNYRLEVIKKRDEQIEKFMTIYNKSHLLFGELISYKRFLKETIQPIYKQSAVDGACEPIYIPKLNFSAPLEEYICLSIYNPIFPAILSNVNKDIEILLSMITTHKNYGTDFNKLKTELKQNISYETVLNKDLNDLIEHIDRTIYWVYILNDKLCKCNVRYFSPLEKGISDSYIIANTSKKYMPKLTDKKYRIEKQYSKIFENHWLRPNNIWQDLELLCRKITGWFRFMFYYLTLDKIFKAKGKK